ncbi:MAG: gliding motility-associated C-terminal domain-containing protein [Muribaculaceae bacterium]|nr:gliding motility-associated C-terminal domain-containing protein [Muribaculaceae bacterium]
MKINYGLFSIIITLCPLSGAAQFMVSAPEAIKIDVQSGTGLSAVYVLPSSEGAEVSFRSGSPVIWQRFSNLGAAYAEEITDVRHEGDEWIVTLGPEDIGLVATSGGISQYVWIVNYANHPFEIHSVGFDESQECDRTQLKPEGQGDRIVYYTINGRPEELSREIEIEYTTLRYDENTAAYQPAATVVSVPSLQPVISVEAPLCDTDFRISGDRFLRTWKREQHAVSDMFQTKTVSAETSAEQTERDVPNEQKDSGSQLGGSAPCEITFTATVSDAAVFREWQISSDPEFGIVDLSYNELEIQHTFREQGTSYVRFIANNAEGSCEYIGETYEVFVGESALRCPNAFTPSTSPGVNDEWRVSYKSLIDFDCHIFNKWGTELFSTTDPSVGWDGKYRGKYVPAGTYYYVIRAEGSDGKKYKLSGDINIIGYHGGSSSSDSEQ